MKKENRMRRIKILLLLPYLFLIVITSVLFQDVLISAFIGVLCGYAYFSLDIHKFKEEELENERN